MAKKLSDITMTFVRNDSRKDSQTCFPVINGEVHVLVKNLQGQVVMDETLKVYPRLRIVDAFETDKGMFHALTGQRQEHYAKNIFVNVYKREFANARKATVIFLKQIQKAIEANESYVQTIFGLKFLDFEKEELKPEVECDF